MLKTNSLFHLYFLKKDIAHKWQYPFLFLLVFWGSDIKAVETLTEKPLPIKKWKIELGKKENKKIVATSLAVALGPFGAHRLYLGTEPKVPIVYTLTLGGFMILPLVDIGHILFTKNISPYENNPHIIMWGVKKEN